MVGSAADRAAAAEVARAFRDARSCPVHDLVGQTDLAALAGVLASLPHARDERSGAMHLAAALGVRVTAVFGPH